MGDVLLVSHVLAVGVEGECRGVRCNLEHCVGGLVDLRESGRDLYVENADISRTTSFAFFWSCLCRPSFSGYLTFCFPSSLIPCTLPQIHLSPPIPGLLASLSLTSLHPQKTPRLQAEPGAGCGAPTNLGSVIYHATQVQDLCIS